MGSIEADLVGSDPTDWAASYIAKMKVEDSRSNSKNEEQIDPSPPPPLPLRQLPSLPPSPSLRPQLYFVYLTAELPSF